MKLSANAKRYKRNHKSAGGDGWAETYRSERLECKKKEQEEINKQAALKKQEDDEKVALEKELEKLI